MQSIPFIVMAALANLALKVGQQVTLFVRDPKVLPQLLGGSFAPHAVVALDDRDGMEVALFAAYDCTCFGADLKGGDAAVGIHIAGPQSDAEKLAIAGALLDGRLEKVLMAAEDVVETEEPEEEPAAPASAKGTPPAEPAAVGDVAPEAIPAAIPAPAKKGK